MTPHAKLTSQKRLFIIENNIEYVSKIYNPILFESTLPLIIILLDLPARIPHKKGINTTPSHPKSLKKYAKHVVK
jgi:hypothetical protein